MTDDRIAQIANEHFLDCNQLTRHQFINFGRAIEAECRVPEGCALIGVPDGSAFGVISFPLPKDHWLYTEREYAPEAIEPIDLPTPILTHVLRKEVVAAMRYAIRAATNCGTISDFDPDALVQNAVYALCGPYGAAAPKPEKAEPERKHEIVPTIAAPVAQEPVAFYIYKETAPRLGIQNVVADSLPWVYDQDPSSGFSARLKVYLAPPDQSAEVERLRDRVAELERHLEISGMKNASLIRDAETYGPEKLAVQKATWKLGEASQRIAELEAEVDRLREKNQNLFNALMAATGKNDELHKQLKEQEGYDGIALQPDLTALREHDAEVLNTFFENFAEGKYLEVEVEEFRRYIERIRKGE